MGSSLSIVMARLSRDIENLPPCPKPTDDWKVNRNTASLLLLELQPLRHRLKHFQTMFPEADYKDLRRKLRDRYQEVRRLCSPIQGCPLEVLSAILSYVVEPVVLTEITGTWGGEDRLAPLYPWAYVSSKFRRALLTNPHHFDHIVFHRFARCTGVSAHRPFLIEMLNFFLGLSGVLPLHIKVVLAFQWGDENSTQTILPACPIIDQLLQRPWKSLDIQGSPRHSTISFLHGIIPRVPPNVLTQLDLHIAEGPTNDSYRALSRLPSTITTLRLSFGCVYPDSGVSFSISLPHITHLRVRGCVRSIFTVLIGSPQVQHLEAVMVGNDMPEWDLIVEMPSLERIWASVESYPGHELLPFFRYLHAPSTNSIVVYWNIGLPQLTPGLSVAMDKFIWHLDNLTELTLLRTPFSFQEARAMQGSATRLFYASADTYRWRFSSLGRYENWGWTRAGSPGGDSDSLASSVENEWGNLTSPDNLWSSHNPWTSTDDPRDYGSY